MSASIDHAQALRSTPPFRAGQRVAVRGWEGALEPGRNPFGDSGRERTLLVDDLGIHYRHDPVSDIVYASPRFSEADLHREYQRAASHVDTALFRSFDRALWARRGDRSYQVSRLKVELVRQRLPSGGRVLDVGCHVGLFVLLAAEAGLDAHGIDLCAEAVRTGTRSVGAPNLRAGTVETADYAPASFDGIVAWDVLEHLSNVVEVMQRCGELLRPGGWLFAQVPNHRGLGARIKTLSCQLRLRGGSYRHFGFPWHLYHFSPRSLRLLVRRAGLEPVQVRSFSHWSKDGRGGARIVEAVERLALSDYIYVVARRDAP